MGNTNGLQRRLTIEEAHAQDYSVDTTVYPHVAYKGPRFRPDETRYVLTPMEQTLLDALRAAKKDLRDLAEAGLIVADPSDEVNRVIDTAILYAETAPWQ